MTDFLRIACACVALSFGCAKSTGGSSEAPARDGEGAHGASSDPNCPAGGPSVSVSVRGHAGGQLPNDELGPLLEWIGGFARPCMEAPPDATHFTLSIELGEEGEAPTLEVIDRETLPGLASCIEAGFAEAPPPPPPGSMKVLMAIPWGCPTLPPDWQAEEQNES